MIGVINTERCNLASVLLAIEKLNFESRVVHEPAEILSCSKLIMPGVGSFGATASYLQSTGLSDAIIKAVDKNEIPILGICLGMQILFSQSEESAGETGLCMLDGHVHHLPSDIIERIPHIGWELAIPARVSALFPERDSYLPYYFSHSYYCKPTDHNIITTSINGTDLCSSVQKGHIFGVQFHPEKSHKMGRAVIQKFLEFS